MKKVFCSRSAARYDGCVRKRRAGQDARRYDLETRPNGAIPATAINQEADFFTLSSMPPTLMDATNCNRFFGRYELKGKTRIRRIWA